jgi:hypothetical protein
LGPVGVKIYSARIAVGALDKFNFGKVNGLSFEVLCLGVIMFTKPLDKRLKRRKPLMELDGVHSMRKINRKVKDYSKQERR